jgi:hypothetical protein
MISWEEAEWFDCDVLRKNEFTDNIHINTKNSRMKLFLMLDFLSVSIWAKYILQK